MGVLNYAVPSEAGAIPFIWTQDDNRNRAAIVRVTCAAWLITVALSWRVYIGNLRIFALSPVIEILGRIPDWADWLMLALNAGFLGWLFLQPLRRAPTFGALACAGFLVSQDLLRFQPYIYMYFVTVLLSVYCTSTGLNALKIMVGSVYFWAGFHKLNLTFYWKVFPWFISIYYHFSKERSLSGYLMTLLAFSVPVFELTIGVLLLFFPRQRQVATGMALVMLVVVLACLGASEWNMIVLPWNLYLFAVEVLLFYNPAGLVEKVRWRSDAPTISVVALFSVAPAFALAGWWHSYPAFKLYSGNTKTAVVLLPNDEDLAHLPKELGQLVNRDRHLMLSDWTVHEFGEAVYPEPYVFRRGAQGLCPYLHDRKNAKLRIFLAAPFYSTAVRYRDFSLCPAKSNDKE